MTPVKIQVVFPEAFAAIEIDGLTLEVGTEESDYLSNRAVRALRPVLMKAPNGALELWIEEESHRGAVFIYHRWSKVLNWTPLESSDTTDD